MSQSGTVTPLRLPMSSYMCAVSFFLDIGHLRIIDFQTGFPSSSFREIICPNPPTWLRPRTNSSCIRITHAHVSGHVMHITCLQIQYSSHHNTGANRANVALNELGVPFEERIINVDGPRPAEFLKLNPRGLVPVLIFNDQVVIESAIVCQFLADNYPSHLCPAPTSPEGALFRAQMSFFIDTYWNKFHTILFRLFEAPTKEDEEIVVSDAINGLATEVEPLLLDAAPFFGGSDKLTLAEVITGPFVIRAVTLSKHGVYPESLLRLSKDRAPNFHSWAIAISKHPSITSIFDEDVIVARSVAKQGRMRKAAGLD